MKPTLNIPDDVIAQIQAEMAEEGYRMSKPSITRFIRDTMVLGVIVAMDDKDRALVNACCRLESDFAQYAKNMPKMAEGLR